MACRGVEILLLWTSRPSWASHLLIDVWTRVASHGSASQEAVGYRKALLTIGEQPLNHYWNLPNTAARMVEPPEEPFPDSWRPLLERGPSTVDSGKELLCNLGVDVLVMKDSGGSLAEAKLTAAADLGVQVVMVRHAPVPEDVPQVATPRGTLTWTNGMPA